MSEAKNESSPTSRRPSSPDWTSAGVSDNGKVEFHEMILPGSLTLRCGAGTKRVSAGRAPRDTGCEWTRIFGAVCPERAETAAPVMPYANTAAMTSPKSRRPSLKAPTPSWRRTGRAGTAQGRCAFPITSRSCRCRPTLHRSTLSKTSGPACAPTRPPPSVQSQHAIMQIGSISRNGGIKRDIRPRPSSARIYAASLSVQGYASLKYIPVGLRTNSIRQPRANVNALTP